MAKDYERARIVERSRRGKRHLAQAGVPSPTGKARGRESMVSALLTDPA